MLRVTCRSSDIVGRLGGEEFAVLVPESSLDAAEALATRLNEACRGIVVRALSGKITCTCSIGMTEATPTDEDIEAVLRRADLALYEAKRSGRDTWRSDRHMTSVDRSQLTLELA